VRPEGKYGDFTDFGMARYTRHGRLDRSFGDGGKVVSHDGAGGSVAIQDDGRIVVVPAPGRLSRYTADGRLDRSFARGGAVVSDFDEAFGLIAVQADGKIVAIGTGVLARYTRDGRLDPSFGRGGRVVTDFTWNPTALAIHGDGRIVVAGSRSPNPDGFALARYTGEGHLDLTFGNSGEVLTSFGPHAAGASASAIAIQPDGKIVAVGEEWGADVENFSYFALARYTRDGKLDASFGAGGKVLTRFRSSCGALSVAIQLDGKIVAGGCGGLARYKSDGSLDS